MVEIDGTIYPQMADKTGITQAQAMTGERGSSFFKKGNEVIFWRPKSAVVSLWDGRKLTMKCRAEGFANRIVNTHETQMHQLLRVGQETRELYAEIYLWSDAVFRIRFGSHEPEPDEPSFSPLKALMLCGRPQESVSGCYEENEASATLQTNRIKIKMNKENFCIQAFDLAGKPFWEQCRWDLFTSDVLDMSLAEYEGHQACFEAFTLTNQEEIYGLGERFDHVSRRGKAVDFWNKDAIGTNNPRTYINVPFLFSTKGYGLFLNSSCRTEWEIGTQEASTLGFSIEDNLMDYFIIYGPTPAEILYNYSMLTGFSPLPPVWSFGLWMSRNSYVSWDIVHEVADRLREKDIPTDVLHLDTAWFKEDWNCDLKFSGERFPNPEEHMEKLKEQGFRVSLWQYNFIPPKENNENYKEGLSKGYFALGNDGKPYSFPEGTIGSWLDDAIIDFSNPEACQWYAGMIRELIKKGAATIKTDFGEGIPEDAIYKNIESKRFHNLYSLVYNSVVAEAIYDISGEYVVWARSGTAGSQRYPIHWGGDSQCSFAGLSGTLRAALSLGMSGFPFFSHDIGGFIGRPDPELYVRWAQVGLFSSHSRCHGAGDTNSREPWAFGEQAERIFRKYAKLRYSLMPYIYNEAAKCCKTAKPMIRALVLEYPEDRNVWHIDDQYMFGDSLLIVPILSPVEIEKTRWLYLPEGTWFDYWTKEVLESHGQWVERQIDLEIMPIYVKSGSIIPYGFDKNSTENEIGALSKIEVYGYEAGTFEHNYGNGKFFITISNDFADVRGLEGNPHIVLY